MLFKLESIGISGEVDKLLENYLSGRLQRVVLDGQFSLWRQVLTGAPQGSILCPLPFLININDLSNEMKSGVKLFADETSLFTIGKDKNTNSDVLNIDVLLISR